MKYWTMTSRVASRLRREVFNGPSVYIYGKETDRLEREGRFNDVRTAIVHLLHNVHYEPQLDIAGRIAELREKHDELMEHPDVGQLFSPKQQERLKGLMAQVVESAREEVNEKFDAEDIRRFVEMAIAGRAYYEERGYDPDDFARGNVVAFAAMMADNFEAYRETLNHTHVT